MTISRRRMYHRRCVRRALPVQLLYTLLNSSFQYPILLGTAVSPVAQALTPSSLLELRKYIFRTLLHADVAYSKDLRRFGDVETDCIYCCRRIVDGIPSGKAVVERMCDSDYEDV